MFRTIDCGTWSDPWFAELESDAKLLFLYLFTNPRTTPCGAFEITVRQITFDTGLASDRIGSLLGQLKDKVEWWPDLNVVWLRNFYRRQAANSNAETYKKAAKKALEIMPGLVKIAVISEYPELKVPLKNIKHPTDTLEVPSGVGTDTLSRDTYSFERRRREEEEKNSEDKSSAAVHPFALLETLCEELGQDVTVLSGSEKSKQLAAGKRLVAAEIDERDIRRIVHWLRAQTWVKTGIDLMTIERYLSRWKLEGKPDSTKDVDPLTLPYNHPRRAAATGKAAIG